MNTIKLQLNLTQFITTGKFDFVKLDMSKEELEAQLFSPEVWLNGETKESSRIWRYGNFELHFNDLKTLSGTFTDYIPKLDGGNSIEITDWWIINKSGQAPTLIDVIQSLNSLKLDYEKSTDTIGIITLKLSNGIHLYFDDGYQEKLEPNQYLLSAIEGK